MNTRAPAGADASLAAAEELERRSSPRTGPLSWYARKAKVESFLPLLPKESRILDIGCGDNWFKRAAAEKRWNHVRSTADIVGDVADWENLGLEPHPFDAIVAFEFVEHGDFSQHFHDLLKPDGKLILTTPVPAMDGLCRALERIGLLQKRGSPHTHLVDLRQFPHFEVDQRRVRALVSRWRVLRTL